MFSERLVRSRQNKCVPVYHPSPEGDVFHLTELYNEHKDYVLYLYRKRYMFSDEYLQMICDTFPEMAGRVDELKGLLYLMDLEKEQWGRRPLAKLTHDIDLQITEERNNP